MSTKVQFPIESRDYRLEVNFIEEVRNSNGKRVCDISSDRKVVIIVQKGCMTRITANPDGTLCIENLPSIA